MRTILSGGFPDQSLASDRRTKKEIKCVCQVDFIWIFTGTSTGQKGLLSKLLWAPLTCPKTTSGILLNAPDLTIIPERERVWVRARV